MYQECELDDMFLLNQLAMIYKEDGDFSKLIVTAYRIGDGEENFRSSMFVSGDFNHLVATFRSNGWMEIIPENSEKYRKVLLLEADGNTSILMLKNISGFENKSVVLTEDSDIVSATLLSSNSVRVQHFIEDPFTELTLQEIVSKNPAEVFELGTGKYNGIEHHTGVIRSKVKKPIFSGFNQKELIESLIEEFIPYDHQLVKSKNGDRSGAVLWSNNSIILIESSSSKEVVTDPPVIHIFEPIKDDQMLNPGVIVKNKINNSLSKNYYKAFNRFFNKEME